MSTAFRKQLRQANEFLQGFDEIGLAYLFGSSAKQPIEKVRDIDCAIYLSRSLSGEEKSELMLELIRDLEKIFNKGVDIVFMNDASPMMCYQILKEGSFLFERQEGLDDQIRFKTMTDYFDYLPLFRFFSATIRKRHGMAT